MDTKRKQLITDLYVALVASGEVKCGDQVTAAEIKEHLEQHDRIQQILDKPRRAPPKG